MAFRTWWLTLGLLAAPLGIDLQAQAVRDTTGAGVGLRLQFADTLPTLRTPNALTAAWAGVRRTPLEREARFDSSVAARITAAAATNRRTRLLTRIYRRSVLEELGLAATDDRALPPREGLFGLESDVVDMTLDGTIRLEMSTERFANLRCTSAQLQDPTSGCQPRFRSPRIDNVIQLTARGLISRRIHVDIDLDTERDFSNNNTIRAFYQGLEDEVLQRVEVGTVRFTPPPSRFLTAGIPSNNFGASANLEYGPVSLGVLGATQEGSVVAERTYRIGDETVQDQERLARDLDYETGRFYWVVDPTLLPGYPRIDALALTNLVVPSNVRPNQVRVYRHRAASGSVGLNPNLGGVTAIGVNTSGSSPQQAGPFNWELLVQGRDYWLDPSGLWFVLTNKLDPNDFLAVSYVAGDGTRVGTFPASDNPARADSVLLVVEPSRGPDAGTFRHAMRQIYRVTGSDLARSSLKVAVVVNRSERPPNDVSTWLSVFGLSIPTDQSVFDTDNRLFPRSRDPGASEVIRDFFVFFPALEPFADQVLVPDPVQRNDSLYRTPEFLLLTQGPASKFQIRLEYTATGGGDRSSINLNALQIREETEQLFVNGRRLVRGVDYSIGYQTGVVSFLDPEGLFGGRAATVTARFEERGFFAVAPTSIVGLTTRWQLGDVGGINLVGLYQSEATAFNRPPLGFEPSASLIGGISTDLSFNTPGVSRFLSGFIPGGVTATSRLDLNAEVAFSKPDPNRSGQATLEEFEADQSIGISLRENAWQFGSLPQRADGVESFGFASGFDSTQAVQLVWQNLIPDGQGGVVRVRPIDIDTNIVLQGSNSNASAESVLFVTFHADTAGGIVGRDNRSRWSLPRQDFAPRWRSMVTPLSLTGVDLSRNEFLEFWVFESSDRPIGTARMQLMIDLGTVSEDALVMAPERFTVNGLDTVFTGRQFLGVGQLDTERSPNGTFNATTDDIGILADRPTMELPDGSFGEVILCRQVLSNAVAIFPWGDLGARCGAGNGVLDTEDLDGDLLLNSRGPNEDAFRYIVDLTDPRFRVRTGVIGARDPQDSTRFAGWTLYRVPLREPDLLIGQPNIRLAKHLRFTMLTPPDNGEADPVVRFALARMRLVGAPWLARAEQPILGISGSLGEPHGRVAVSSISTENIELGYTSPPGLGSSVNQVGGGLATAGLQINEKSLRIVVQDLRDQERAEAFTRFVSGSQNLLAYRELRVWARGRGPGWDSRELRAYVKVGADDRNFYYFEAPANTALWEPEMVVNIDLWRALRARAETAFLQGQPPSGAAECGGDPEAWVACEDGHLVQLRDPAINPPNLAAVQELAAGIRRVVDGAPIAETELWIDDIRLDSPLAEVGVATALSGRLQAGDVADIALSFVSQDGQFRQVGQDPSYRATSTFVGSTTLQLGRFLSPSLGLIAPLTVSHTRASVRPELLTGSDLPAEALPGLRRPLSTVTSMALTLRRTRRDGSGLVQALVNPLSWTGSMSSSSSNTEYSEASNNNWSTAAVYQLSPRRRTIPLGLGGLVGGLPSWLRESEGAKGLASGGLTLLPTNMRFASTLSRQAGEFTSFAAPIRRLEDTAATPLTTLQHLWRSDAGLTWQPLGMLTITTSWASTRDLRVYGDSTPLARLAGQERRQFLGVDAGVERDRNINTAVTLSPRLTAWLRPRLSSSSGFVLSRNLTTRNPVRVDGDTAGAFILPQTLNNSRTTEIAGTLDPAILVRRVFGEESGVTTYLQRFRVLDVSRRLTRQSTFDLAAFDPGAGFQLGLGGLNSFLQQGNTFAVGAVETRTTNATGGFDLPLGLSATTTFTRTESDRFQRSTGDRFILIQNTQRDWPNATVRWSRSLRNTPIQLISFSGTIRERESRNVVPSPDAAATPAINSSETRSISPDLQLIFTNGLSFIGTLNQDRGTALNNGNTIEREGDRWSAQLNWQVRLPQRFSATRRPLRTVISAQGIRQEDCLVNRGTENLPCEIISSITRREVGLRLEADVATIANGALNFQYITNELKHLDQKTSTLIFSLTLTVPLAFGGF
ncbi:MAG: hypothetical protein U0994_05110 [Gemmatimonadales bacterium]|nr:hypothetical protein [Gemmatimonadales bacterium]